LVRLTEAPSASSSSTAFFFLLPLAVGWLDSRVGKDEVGVGACEGVVWVEPGVDASLRKLDELRLKMRSASLTWALRRVAVPAPAVAVVVAAPLM
jgi:hypothetical protein